MKYYKHRLSNASKLYKERINELEKKDRTNHKISSVLIKITFLITIAEAVLIIYFAKNMNAFINNEVVAIIISTILWLLLIPLLLFTLVGLISLINHFFPEAPLDRIKGEAYLKVNSNKFKYYRLNDNYIITKCYYSNHLEFIDHDVIVCFINNKIKIANDLYHSIDDLGCYEFDINEIRYFNIKEDDLVKTKIVDNNDVFILGYRTRTFINKNINND